MIPVATDRAGLNLMGLWSVLMKAKNMLDDCATEDYRPDPSSIRWAANELKGAAEVLAEIAESERASK